MLANGSQLSQDSPNEDKIYCGVQREYVEKGVFTTLHPMLILHIYLFISERVCEAHDGG
jgi:hypothetical protein